MKIATKPAEFPYQALAADGNRLTHSGSAHREGHLEVLAERRIAGPGERLKVIAETASLRTEAASLRRDAISLRVEAVLLRTLAKKLRGESDKLRRRNMIVVREAEAAARRCFEVSLGVCGAETISEFEDAYLWSGVAPFRSQ